MKNHIFFEVLLLSTDKKSGLNRWRTTNDYGSRQAKVDKKPGARCWQLFLSKHLLQKHHIVTSRNGVWLPLQGRMIPVWRWRGKAHGTPVARWVLGEHVIVADLFVHRSPMWTPTLIRNNQPIILKQVLHLGHGMYYLWPVAQVSCSSSQRTSLSISWTCWV